MLPVVLNKYKLKSEDKGVYCDRGSPWGNPFAMDEDLGRNTVCDMFASTPVNQARALATILNEKCGYLE